MLQDKLPHDDANGEEVDRILLERVIALAQNGEFSRALKALESTKPVIPDNQSYFDLLDLHPDASPPNVQQDHPAPLQDRGPEYSLTLSLAKSEVWWPSLSLPKCEQFLPKEIQRNDSPGTVVLGTPIGDPEFVKDYLEDTLNDAEDLFKRLRAINDPQISLNLLRLCLGYTRVNHLLRNCEGLASSYIAENYDESIRTCLSEILGCTITDTMYEQACLPIRFGGLGLTSANNIGACAFAGARFQVKSLLEKILTPEQCAEIDIDYKEIREQFGEFELPEKPTQHALSQIVHEKLYEKLFNQSSVAEKAILRGVTQKYASAYLQTVPCPNLGLSFAPEQFRMVVRFRLRDALYSQFQQCPDCITQVIGQQGEHSLGCSKSGGLLNRHESICQVLSARLSSAKFAPVREVPNLFKDSMQRPADIYVPIWFAGSPLALDITVTTKLHKEYVYQAAEQDGYAAAQAEEAKNKLYNEQCEDIGMEFSPIVVEDTGGWGAEAIEFFRQVATRLAIQEDTTFQLALQRLMQQLSVGLQKSNGAMLLLHYKQVYG